MNYVDLVRTIVTDALLIGFFIVFAQEALLIWRKQNPHENYAQTYILTAVRVVVGSITAFAKFPEQMALLNVAPSNNWRAIYAGVDTLKGVFAVVTWAIGTGWSSALMKNLATTSLARGSGERVAYRRLIGC